VQFCSGIFSNFLSLKPWIESQISDPVSNPVFGSGFHSGTKTFISVQLLSFVQHGDGGREGRV
jgi:hypothetical protein